MSENHRALPTDVRRRAERVAMDGNVKIRFATEAIVGSGQNVSSQGVFFVSEGRVPVTVTIEGRDGDISGELVRIENMGNGQFGLAVKFDQPHDDLVG
ncbi:MAG: PilZ domain-containing protein [Planctomycetes bacterium]|nr:PilZ domain-containing protein [Planctomycetota bacterium]